MIIVGGPCRTYAFGEGGHRDVGLRRREEEGRAAGDRFHGNTTISIDWLHAHVAKTNYTGRGVGEVCQAVSPGVKFMLFYFPSVPSGGTY